nr:Pls/PosA family non-ribosomal peptide synthetase [Corynebacterium mendelii]
MLSDQAPAPRTLVDVFAESVARHPDAAALDDGRVVTYRELDRIIAVGVDRLAEAGLRRGDRVGVRLTSGRNDLYIAIVTVLHAGCAYVPVDADDPDERVELVFSQADVAAVITDDGITVTDTVRSRLHGDGGRAHPVNDDRRCGPPGPDDDAWIIFTSGSTGLPKGVAVTHRSAAAFVDAEARHFLVSSPGGPLGPEDRVLAGLSVGFDASCEEIWLAFGHGACLVPAPRRLVRSGMDLGPWLIRQSVTVVSTVPTLAGMWPAEALDSVRLLIFGGEACPAELVERLATDDREVWNTYGPTEATVVSTLAPLEPGREVSIGVPLDGWDTVVVDGDGMPVGIGQTGELVIGGVGLARYLDADKDAEKFAPAPQLGWRRAYRSGDHVRLEEDGLYFVGRIDDQVKIGGRRIELGEINANVGALDNVKSAAVVVRTTAAADKVLVAYLSLVDTAQGFDHTAATERLAATMPRALVPRIHVMEDLPVTSSGKVDKKSLPWPLPGADVTATGLGPVAAWLAELWVETLAVSVDSDHADFFSLGGTSLAAAGLVARIRGTVPTVSVRDLYDHPRLGALADRITDIAEANGIDLAAQLASGSAAAPSQVRSQVAPVPAGTRLAQAVIQIPVMIIQAATWIAWLAVGNTIGHFFGLDWAVDIPWPVVAVMFVVFATPLGRLPVGALCARLITAGITAGDYPRGGAVHLRLWAAQRITDAVGAQGIAGAAWVQTYARALGARIGTGATLHSLPPVTGMLQLGDYASVEPDCDLSGIWIDGDTVHVGTITIKDGARIGARSVLYPNTVVGKNAHVESGSAVTATKKIKASSRWAGSPARKVGRPKHRFPDTTPPRAPQWVAAYAAAGLVVSLLPVVALAAGAVTALWLGGFFTAGPPRGTADIILAMIPAVVCGTAAAFAVYMLQVTILIRLAAGWITAGVHPVRSRQGVALWMTERLLDAARTHLFALYAAQLTPWWFKTLGATIGTDVEISTAVMIPKLTEIKDGAFLADDTTIGGYELGGGWLTTDRARIGKRSFLGNSGLAGPGRKLSKNSLVAVLSAVPKKTKSGSNWWGSPPERLRRTAACCDDQSQTYSPTAGLKARRGAVETLRLFAPVTSFTLAAAVVAVLQAIVHHAASPLQGLVLAWLAGGPVLMLAGLAAAVITVTVKWVCVGRISAGDHPLWSSFVWRNELQDTFVETVAAPWFSVPNLGTGSLNMFLRVLGATIGRGAWIDSYWLPEADLVTIGDGASVGPGCVVQTHLFQDRVMTLDRVTIGDGATLASQSVMLPASTLGTDTVIHPASLVMRGDHVPDRTRWRGNPIEPQK